MSSVGIIPVQISSVLSKKKQSAAECAIQDNNQRLESSRVAGIVGKYIGASTIEKDMTVKDLVAENVELLEKIAKNKREETAAHRKQNTLFKKLQDAVKNFDEHVAMKDVLVTDGARMRERRVLVKSHIPKPTTDEENQGVDKPKKEQHVSLRMSIGIRSTSSIIKKITKFNVDAAAEIQTIAKEPLDMKRKQAMENLVKEHKKLVLGTKNQTLLTLEKIEDLTNAKHKDAKRYAEFVTKFEEAEALYNRECHAYTLRKIEMKVADAIKLNEADNNL